MRPFLTQSDSASRKRPFLIGLFFDWNLLVIILIVSRAVLLYGSRKSVGISVLERVLREQRVLALDEPSSQRVGGFVLIAESYVRPWSSTQPKKAAFVELHSAESRQSYSKQA